MLSTDDLLMIISNLRSNLPSVYRGGKSTTTQVLDPGHGGIVDGHYTTAPSKMFAHPTFTFYEGVWNRALMYLTALELYNSRLNYVILVEHDFDESLSNRCDMLRDMATSGNKYWLHSIHGNAAGVEQASGIEVWTSPGQTKSDPIATIAYMKLKERLGSGWKMRPDFGDGDPDKEERFKMLVGHPLPAILTENGFYTNEEQAKRMLKFAVMAMMAQAFRDTHLEVEHLNLLR
jgi:N-acetylmuramoyl-L-alanine amidase